MPFSAFSTQHSPLAYLVAQASSLLPARMAGLPDAADPTSLQTDRLDTETTPAWTAIMDHIQTLVGAIHELPLLRDALLAAYGDLPTDQLTDIMGMAFAAADLAGRYDVTEDN